MGEIRKIAGTDEDRSLARPRALRNDLELHIVEVANSDQVQAALVEIDEWKPGGPSADVFFNREGEVGRDAVCRGQRPVHDRRY